MASGQLREPQQEEQNDERSRSGIPALFTKQPAIRDRLVTETSQAQDETVEQCLPFLKGCSASQNPPFSELGLPRLYRDAHVEFLYDALEDYPPKFVGLDASRPWMVYWALNGLCLLGEDVTKFRRRYVLDLFLFFPHSLLSASRFF